MRTINQEEAETVSGGIAPLAGGALVGGATGAAHAIYNGASPAGVVAASVLGAASGFYGAAVKIYSGLTAVVSGLAAGAAGVASKEAGGSSGGSGSSSGGSGGGGASFGISPGGSLIHQGFPNPNQELSNWT